MWKGASLTAAMASLVVLAGCSPDSAARPRATAAVPSMDNVTFEANVKPIFAAHCEQCHIEQMKGRLSLATRESVLKGGKSGVDIAVGDAEDSLLYAMVDGDGRKRMPPKGDLLNPTELATIRNWIDEGAR